MGNIRIDTTTRRTDIQQQLKTFGRFSLVEASLENNSSSNNQSSDVIFLREVGVGERLARLFSRKDRSQAKEQSNNALGTLSEQNPAIAKLLGFPILGKSSFAASTLLKKLQVSAQQLKPSSKEGKLDVGSGPELGVINARAEKIQADKIVSWSYSSNEEILKKITSSGTSEKIIRVVHAIRPKPVHLEAAYRAALTGAKGHVVIEPILDEPDPDTASANNSDAILTRCSNENIDILLKVIDEIMNNPERNMTDKITIACGAVKKLADQVWDRSAYRGAVLISDN